MKLKHLKLYESFLNEGQDGYGRDYYVKEKDGKVVKYFFKIKGEEEDLAFVLSLGKLSRSVTVESAENSYAVLNVEPIKENVLDDYLVKETDYKSRQDEVFPIQESEFIRMYNIVGEAINDYLQNNPKVSTIYDEMPLNLEMEMKNYKNNVRNLIDTWSNNKWGLQEGSADRTLIYNRRDHE